MSLRVQRESERVVVEVEGELVAANRGELRDVILAQLDDGAQEFVIDFLKTRYIDSSGLSVLVNLWKRIREEGGDLRLANLSEDLRSYFQLARLDGVFRMADSQETAPEDF